MLRHTTCHELSTYMLAMVNMYLLHTTCNDDTLLWTSCLKLRVSTFSKGVSLTMSNTISKWFRTAMNLCILRSHLLLDWWFNINWCWVYIKNSQIMCTWYGYWGCWEYKLRQELRVFNGDGEGLRMQVASSSFILRLYSCLDSLCAGVWFLCFSRSIAYSVYCVFFAW